MKLIESKVEYLPQGKGMNGIYKQIEMCGRTCYKSEDKITDTSAEKFVTRMISSNHTAMLEHGTVYLKVPGQGLYNQIQDHTYRDYVRNPYSKAKTKMLFEKEEDVIGLSYSFVTSNLRVLQENYWLNDLQYLCEPTEFHKKRYTFKFTCSRAIANELVRHRVFSFAQESQRYCNYGRDKFGNEVTFIAPHWLPELAGKSIKTMVEDIEARDAIRDNQRTTSASWFTSALIDAERCYFEMLNGKSSPQQARDVLPNATKTELCMTGFTSDWKRLLDLRLFQKTGVVHPDMLDLMKKLEVVAKENNIWDELL